MLWTITLGDHFLYYIIINWLSILILGFITQAKSHQQSMDLDHLGKTALSDCLFGAAITTLILISRERLLKNLGKMVRRVIFREKLEK